MSHWEELGAEVFGVVHGVDVVVVLNCYCGGVTTRAAGVTKMRVTTKGKKKRNMMKERYFGEGT